MRSQLLPQVGGVLMVASLSLQALVDRPDETRRVMNFKRLALTDHKLDVPRLAKKKAIKEALETNGEQLQTCRAGAHLRQGAHMPCHRNLSQTIQCAHVQHQQPTADCRAARRTASRAQSQRARLWSVL